MNIRESVLAVHPFSRGFGWIVFAASQAPIDWGVVERRKDRNTKCLLAAERIVDRYQPDVMVLEAFELPAAKRVSRIRHLCRSMQALAETRAIDVTVYSITDIQTVFARAGAASRYEIACIIAQQIDALRSRLPKKRATWEGEPPSMALFNAAAVGLSHYHRADGSFSA